MDAKQSLYDLDLTDATWISAERGPGSPNRSDGPDGQHSPTVQIAMLPDGAVAMRDSSNQDGPVLRFTEGEWRAFLSGAKDGEFG
jgi:hypothetical protein